MYQEFFVKKLIKISEEITDKFSSQKSELEEKINELNNNLAKIKEQLDNDKELIENKNKEKSEINKNYFELETKFDKFNRDYKIKLKENENALSIELSKYSKMENYYLSQLKDKEKLINSLENKIEKINKEMQSISKENSMKINELNRENNRLLNEVERIKEIKNKNGDYGLGTGGDKNINVNSILKTVNKNFIDFKESVENLKNENNSIQKNKYLELSKEEIESKLNNVLNDVKNFCSNQIKTVSDNYEKLIKKAKTDFEELNFELSKKDYALNEQILLKETYEKKFNESNKSIEKLKSMTQDKENLINTQKSSFKVYENRINDLEMKLAENIYNLRMKEDEVESIFMIIQYMLAKNAHKFEQNLNKISVESQQYLKNLAKQYKLFK
jgi:chromosome segregation ATPase